MRGARRSESNSQFKIFKEFCFFSPFCLEHQGDALGSGHTLAVPGLSAMGAQLSQLSRGYSSPCKGSFVSFKAMTSFHRQKTERDKPPNLPGEVRGPAGRSVSIQLLQQGHK